MKPFDHKLCNIEISSFNKEQLLSQIKYYKNFFNRYNVILRLDNYEDAEKLQDIIMELPKNGIDLSCCNICVDITTKVFSKQEFNSLNKLKNIIENNGAVLFFKELNVLWFDTEVDKAYKEMFKVVNKADNPEYSPLEKLLILYKETTNRIYKEEEKFEEKIISRSYIGVHNSEDIVCAGYAELLNAYCKILNDPNIKCEISPVNVIDKETNKYVNGHCFNIIYIDDPKYNVKGYYLIDACWDSKKTENDNMKLSYFLLPLKDIDSYIKYDLESIQTNKFSCFFTKTQYSIVGDKEDIYDILNTQTLFDVKKERMLFKNQIISRYQTYNISPNKEDLKKITDAIDSRQPTYEQLFLKTMVNKVLTDTKPLQYEKIRDALFNVTLKELKDTFATSYNFTNDVLNGTKTCSLYSFEDSATNCFYVLAKREQEQSQEFIKRMKAKREKIRQKKYNNDNFRNTEI